MKAGVARKSGSELPTLLRLPDGIIDAKDQISADRNRRLQPPFHTIAGGVGHSHRFDSPIVQHMSVLLYLKNCYGACDNRAPGERRRPGITERSSVRTVKHAKLEVLYWADYRVIFRCPGSEVLADG